MRGVEYFSGGVGEGGVAVVGLQRGGCPFPHPLSSDIISPLFLFSLDESDSDDDDEILDDDEPDMDTVMIQHSGAVNRIRVITGLTR